MDNGGTDYTPQDQTPQPAGWYPDGSGNQRYWDGLQWSEQTAPLPVPTSGTDPKTIAALMHVSALFVGFIGPLVGYLAFPNDPFVKESSRHALNFQLTMLIGFIISFILIFVIVGIFTTIAIGILMFVAHILGAIAASKGEIYHYPVSIPFIKN